MSFYQLVPVHFLTKFSLLEVISSIRNALKWTTISRYTFVFESKVKFYLLMLSWSFSHEICILHIITVFHDIIPDFFVPGRRFLGQMRSYGTLCLAISTLFHQFRLVKTLKEVTFYKNNCFLSSLKWTLAGVLYTTRQSSVGSFL